MVLSDCLYGAIPYTAPGRPRELEQACPFCPIASTAPFLMDTTYDRKVGLSRTTGQVTHHIDADIDAERDHLFQNLEKTGDMAEVYTVADFHKTRAGRNGGGDPWHTDGNLTVGVIAGSP